MEIAKAQREKEKALILELEEELAAELAAGLKYVAMFALPPRTGAQYVSRYGGQPIWDRDRAAVHAARDCGSIKGMAGVEVRMASPGEVAHLGRCLHHRFKVARGEIRDATFYVEIERRFKALRRTPRRPGTKPIRGSLYTKATPSGEAMKDPIRNRQEENDRVLPSSPAE